MKETPYPRWAGVLAAMFLPGIAHYLSGSTATGMRWLLVLLLLPLTALDIAAIPSRPMVMIGLVIIFVATPLLYLWMLVQSFRPMRRIGFRGWIFFFLIGFSIGIAYSMARGSIVEPFRVPTGSMHPTVRGLLTDEGNSSTSLADFILTGKKHETVRAAASGEIRNIRLSADGITFSIGDTPHRLPGYTLKTFRPAHYLNEGDILWEGTVHSGDHILLEKASYWLGDPKRGDIIVFKTDGIDHPAVRNDTIFIKRIVALPGETISIDPPLIRINGKPMDLFAAFAYGNAGQLDRPSDSITLGCDEYFVLGDNTAPNSSLDSRHFGAIPHGSIVGKVSTIYWPLNRIGPVK